MRLRLGTRRSPLALAQSALVARMLETRHPGLAVDLVGLTTRGDTTPGSLAKLGGKGLFTEELEAGLLDGSLDLAVHSLKDLPVRLPVGLTIAAYPPRADPRDGLVTRHGDLASLPEGSRILTGSLRRRGQLLRLRPDLNVEDVRGNVGTRLRKWKELGAAGVVLAMAGLERLGIDADEAPAQPLDPLEIIPSPGQGTLALEVAAGSAAESICKVLDDPVTAAAASAERAVVAAFGGDCTLPLGAWANPIGECWQVNTFLGAREGGRWLRSEALGDDAMEAAREATAALEAQGAKDLLDPVEK